MQAWQWMVLAFVVLVPFALMLDFWGDERFGAHGRPRPRPWRPPPRPAPRDDEH